MIINSTDLTNEFTVNLENIKWISLEYKTNRLIKPFRCELQCMYSMPQRQMGFIKSAMHAGNAKFTYLLEHKCPTYNIEL